ncbi:YkgJ family cysteine cluster protein [Advenella sp. RU8]|uniref:YkgJ family cysteine cluster protein n=1 Tax=Advenella sp. RU8 TaxID=3399575 RepID=UPI003AAF89B4
MKYIYPCTRCGLCCQHVDRLDETQFLNRGDGICKHYHELGRRCEIYDERPEICRVESVYKKHYAKFYDWDQYVEMNMNACLGLQLEEKSKK